jgi:geranylgeranyl diphosphate synthase type II
MGIYTEKLLAHCRLFEQEMPGFLPQADGARDTVIQAMVYACADGGKRIRPVLTMEFCELVGGDVKDALPFAAAIEMIHSYSLIHDDMPCMDNSDLRRGKPAVHKAFGEDMALLAGDGLLNRAFEVTLSYTALSPERVLTASKILADAAGVMGMVGGQCIDLESEGKDIDLARLQLLQQGKTAALLSAACAMGVAVGGGTEEQLRAATAFGENLGLAFQVVDDILDVTAQASVLGKPVGSDAQNQKVTYVSLCGLDGARQMAAEKTDAAIKALECFGGDTASLKMLAQALLERKQ